MTAYTKAGATIKGQYRYSLYREWRDMNSHDDANWWLDPKNVWRPKPFVFIMLNPSTADGKLDDPTIRKCVKYAQREKYERLEVINLFAFRATAPDAMKAAGYDAIGPQNDAVIVNTIERAGAVVCAWGAHGRYLGRDFEVVKMVSNANGQMKALFINTDGTPKHPLYCRDDQKLIEMVWRA